MNTYLYLLGENKMHVPLPIPTPSVSENTALQLTWNQSIFFLPNVRGLFCNINVVSCLQKKGATLLYNLYFHNICHQVSFPPPVLLQSPDGAWPALANFWFPLFLFQAHLLLCTECDELRLTHRCPDGRRFQNATSFDMLVLFLSAQQLLACWHLKIISWSFGKHWFLIHILWKLQEFI